MQYRPEIERALERLLEAARDTAEFHHGLPTGRSRQASIRRLKQAVDAIDTLAERIDSHELQRQPKLRT